MKNVPKIIKPQERRAICYKLPHGNYNVSYEERYVNIDKTKLREILSKLSEVIALEDEVMYDNRVLKIKKLVLRIVIYHPVTSS